MRNRTDSGDFERKRSFAVCSVLLAGVTIVLVLTMPNCVYVGDAVAVRAGTVNLLNAGKISVPAEYAQRFGKRGQYFFQNPRNGLWYSKYGMLNSLLYVPPLFAERCVDGQLRFFDLAGDDTLDRRCLSMNLYNIFISLCITLYFFSTAKLYVRRGWQAALFAAVILFGTFLWNYLRAQTVEIFQVFFFIALYYHLARYVRLRRGKTVVGRAGVHLTITFTFLGLLCWSKLIYVLIVPSVALFVTLAEFDRSRFTRLRDFMIHAGRRRKQLLCTRVLLPIGCIVGVMALANWYCFGSPLNTGYEQWAWGNQFLTADMSDGLLGFWSDPQKSIPLYFPPLAFALLGLRRFWREYRSEYGFAVSVFITIYIASSVFGDWKGGWCFGPRYLLFVLPVLSIPILSLFHSPSGTMYWRGIAVTGAVLVSVWFASKQMVVHSVEFFTPVRAEQSFAHIADSRLQDYFSKPFWVINRDLIHWNSGMGKFPPLEFVDGRLSRREYKRMVDRMQQLAVHNLFWLEFRKRKQRIADGIE
ncbi:MAG: hypothetical protein VB876_11400 [Pirellulales bacterium]